MPKFFCTILLAFVLASVQYIWVMEEAEVQDRTKEINEEITKLSRDELIVLMKKYREKAVGMSNTLDKMNELYNEQDELSDSDSDSDSENLENNPDQNLKSKWGQWTTGDSWFFGGLLLAGVWCVYRYFTYKEEIPPEEILD